MIKVRIATPADLPSMMRIASHAVTAAQWTTQQYEQVFSADRAVWVIEEGSRVMVSGRRDDAGQALVTELRALGAEAEFVRADVRREDDVRNLVDKTVARFGRLDVAVNNAGSEGQLGLLTKQSAET